MKKAFLQYKKDLEELIEAYKAVRISDAFINILFKKIDIDILAKLNLDKAIKNIIKKYPDRYVSDLFFVRLVTLLEEYLKNRLVEEFDKNEIAVENFLLNHHTDRKLTAKDVISGPNKLALSLLDDTIFHNLPKVERIYFATFGFDIKKLCNFKSLVVITKLRHIIVHNGGKIEKNKKKFLNLQIYLNEINRLVENIEFHIKEGRCKKVIKYANIDNYTKSFSEDSIQDLIDYEIIKAWGIE